MHAVGVRRQDLPAAYLSSSTLASDMPGVNALSREFAHRLLHGLGSLLPVPDWYRVLTTASMPQRFRVEFSLPYSEQEEAAAHKVREWLPRIYRRLPDVLRIMGPYQEARGRLIGSRVEVLTRASNRFWIGRAQMRFREPEH